MKAREYVEKYKANPTPQTLGEIVKEMVFEIEEIAKMRHARSNEAFISIFEEQDRKWRAFVRMVNDPNIRPDGFMKFCQMYFPEVFEKT